MTYDTSRRGFLSASLALPLATLTSKLGPFRSQTSPAPTDSPVKLDYRTLGKTGLKVTTLGFGCMVTSDPSVITRAADLGITYFDTARVYQHGNNEKMVGAALKGKRNQIVLSTKSPADDKDGALKDLDTSLRELGTDHVDIWYLHAKTKPSEIRDDLIEAQQIAKQQGKIRFAGVSTHSGQKELLPWMAQKNAWDVVLVAYNFTMDAGMEQAVEAATKGNLGRRGYESHGRRLQEPEARRSRSREVASRRCDALSPQVGAEESERLHDHPQHDRYGSVGRKSQSHGPALRRSRRKITGHQARHH